jgi:hypothetical protein
MLMKSSVSNALKDPIHYYIRLLGTKWGEYFNLRKMKYLADREECIWIASQFLHFI